jgi:hypothetical protein
MSNNRHKKKNSNHPKPKTLIDSGSTYSPNSIGGRIDLQALRDKLFCQEEMEFKRLVKKLNDSDAKDS